MIFNKYHRTRKKKGELGFQALMFTFVRSTIVFLVMFSFIVVVRRYIVTDIDITALEPLIFLYGVFLNPHGPSMTDDMTQRTYSYTIDAGFFRGNPEEELGKIFNYKGQFEGEERKFVAMKITLFDEKNDPYISHGLENHVAYLNKEEYYNWIGLARMKFAEDKPEYGPGSVTETNRRYFVNVFDDGEYRQGVLDISILMLKS